jgi:Tol biopolymer transport system component
MEPVSWSPDGKLLMYWSTSATTREDLTLLPLDGDRQPRPLLAERTNENDGCFSPDGRWVVYSSSESGQNEVFVVPFPGPGRRSQISTTGGFLPRWRGDGREILYHTADQKLMSVEVEVEGGALRSGPPRELFDLPAGASLDVSSDGERLLVTRPLMQTTQTPLRLVTNWQALLGSR